MSQDKSNPYAPPSPVVEEEQSETIADTIGSLGTVEFSGRLTIRELDEYLRADNYVGCAGLAMLGIGFIAPLSVLPMLGISYLAISLGAIGIVSIMLIVSTLPYRRAMYINANPRWSDLVTGALRSDGVHVQRDGSTSYYHWNWFGEAIESEALVALLPATQPAFPLLFSREMFSTVEGWESLQRVSQAVGTLSNDLDFEDVRRDRNLQILKDDQRGWTFSPPDGSIAFEGIVWSDDYERLPRQYRNHQRPLRTHLVIYELVGFAGLVLGGCSGVVFHQIAILPVIVAIYFFAAMAIGRRRRRRSRSVIYYLRGYAGDDSIVTDFGLSVGETKWEGLDLIAESESSIVLRRRSVSNFIVIRRDMFASEDLGDRFRQLVGDRLGTVSGT